MEKGEGDSALAMKHVTVSPLSVWLEKTKHVSPYAVKLWLHRLFYCAEQT